MIPGREFHEILKNIFQDVKGIDVSAQLQINCPKCQDRDGLDKPDGKYNLEINTEKRVFRCWKCTNPDFSGTLGKLIRIYGSESDYELYKSFYGSFFGDFKYDEDEYKPIYLPRETIFFSEMDKNNSEHLEAYSYLVVKRGLSKKKILDFNLGFCLKGRYKKRIIIPSYNISGDVNYFVSRSYDSKTKNKYDNPKRGKGSVVFNELFINFDSVVFLVEGVFDMFVIPNSIPLLGKELTLGLFLKLNELKPYVIIGLDPDAKKEECELYMRLKNIYGEESYKVKAMMLRGELDIDEIYVSEGREGLIKKICQSKRVSDDDYFRVFYG